MEKANKLTSKKVILAIASVFLVCICILGGLVLAKNNPKKVTVQEEYGYINPDETKADADEGITIDGVFDEAQYQNNNWLYLHNDEEGMDVEVAMTSWFGDKGIYFAYDVTEKTNIYVNLNRSSALNSGIEMYLVPNYILDVTSDGFFEIDLMPTGDINFKMTNGKGGYVSAATTDDKMPYLGTTTKGGEVNTEDCHGYTLEFFIPWDYMEWLGLDVDEMKDGFVYVDPVHITSYNIDGTNMSKDRYWYRFASQQGVSFGRTYQFYRFNDNGAIGTVPVTLEEGENYSITGDESVLPGVVSPITITPDKGYTINSILVNGEEYIKKASYNEDGSVALKVRGEEEGLTVSATAVPEAKGNVTLSGTLIANKYGGDSLSDISIKYKGPKGERPIEFDSKGNFILTDLEQGYYKIKVEKEGYTTLNRNIYLNRDTEIELSLEYEMFDGNAVWILDDQNDGLIRRFGGGTTTLTKDSYSKFTFESYFHYDTELAKEYDHDFFLEQRQGLRIAFSNEKTWCIDILYQDGKYFVQYGNGQIYKWQSPYTLTQADINKFTSEEGIKLAVQRDGKYANIYLDDKLIAVEVLDDEFAKCTAKLGLEGWVASRKVMNHPFKITQSTEHNLKSLYFKRTSGWDLSRIYDGIISLPEGGRANLKMIEKMVNMDFTIRVQDNQNSTDKEGTYPRTDILFVFENGAHVSFGITSDGKSAWVQSMNQSKNKVDGKETPYIYPQWTKWYDLTEEEFKQYQNGGVDFRIVRYGTEVTLYIGDKMVAVADLTNNDRGVTADMPAEITIRHYDDAGVQIDFPFSVKETFDLVTINSIPNENGKVATEKQTYFVGDTVKLLADKEDYYCTSMKVNGQDVALDMDGTYSFKATEKEYTVEGTLAKKVFKDNENWNILKQNVGVVSLPNGGNGGMLTFYDQYTDMDLTITAKDYVVDEVVDGKAVYERTDVLYVFENGAGISFGIVQSDNGAIVQTMNHKSHEKIYGNWTAWGTLTEEEFAQYQNGGVKLRLVRIGTEIAVYIGDRYLGFADLTKNNSGVTADIKATVSLRHYDDSGVQVEIPFEVNTELDIVPIHVADDIEHGQIICMKNALRGEQLALTVAGDKNYFYDSLKVNGKDVIADYKDGTYTFTATEDSYNVDASFAERTFKNDANAYLMNQNIGMVVQKKEAEKNINIEFAKRYTNFDITMMIRDYDLDNDADGDGNNLNRTNIRMHFDQGVTTYRQVNLSLARNNLGDGSKYTVQSMGNDTILPKNKDLYTLSESEVAKYKSAEGIEFRVIRNGAFIDFYVDGHWVYEVDLTKTNTGDDSGITATTDVKLNLIRNDDIGNEVQIPITVSETVPETVDVEVAEDVTNGTITTNRKLYLPGDEVKFTVTPDSGYDCTGITVKDANGEDVAFEGTPTHRKGTYSFTVTATDAPYTISATFAKEIFDDSSNWSDWNLFRQYEGILMPKAEPEGQADGYTGYLRTLGHYNAFSYTVKEPAEAENGFAVGGQFYFVNGKYITFRIIKDGENYHIDSTGGAIFGSQKYYTLNETQVEKLKTQGVEFKAVRKGTSVELYLDGVQLTELSIDNTSNKVSSIDLKNYINADTASEVKFVKWGKVDIEIPFTLTSGATEVWVASTGNDTYNSGTEESPYRTLNQALSQVSNNGTIHVKDNLVVPESEAWAAHGKNVTITGDDSGALDFSQFSLLQIRDGVTFQDIKLTWPSGATGTGDNIILAEGNPLVVSDSVDILNTNTNIQIHGGGSSSTVVASTSIEIHQGTYKAIYGGGYGNVIGDTRIVIGSGVNANVNYEDHDPNYVLYGGSYSKEVGGNTYVEVREGAKFNYIFGGGDRAASKVKGTTEVRFAGNAMAIYGGSNLGQNGSTKVVMTGGSVQQIFGGCQSASMTGNTDVQVLGGTVARRIYGGCYNADDNDWATDNHVTGYTTVSIGTDANVTLAMNSWRLDNSLSALTRDNKAFTDEKGVFIFNDYTNCSSGISKIKADAAWFGASSKTHDYLVKATAGGNVTSAGDKLQITPDTGNVTKVTVDNTDTYYVGNVDYTLPQVASDPKEILITFVKTEDANLAARIGSIGYVDVDEAITALNATTETDIEIYSDQIGVLTITCGEHGKVEANPGKYYKVGTDVTLTVIGDTNYFYNSLKVDGESVIANYKDGTYTFEATKDSYDVEVSFSIRTFKNHNSAYLINQNVGMVVQKKEATENINIEFADRYTNFDITMMVKDYDLGDAADQDGNNTNRTNIRMHFDKGVATYRQVNLSLAKHNASTYSVQSMGSDTILPSNTHLYTLSESEIAKYKSAEGIEFRVIRNGAFIDFYLDGHWVYEVDLTKTNTGDDSGITATTDAKLNLIRNDDLGNEVQIPITVSKTLPAQSTVTASTDNNGTITFVDHNTTDNVTPDGNYIIGEKVTFKVDGNEVNGVKYYYNSLKVDGEEVIVDENGEYTFTASKATHTVEATFAPAIFDTHADFNVLSQNVGVLRVPASEKKETGWIVTKDSSYEVVTATVKVLGDETNTFAFYEEFVIGDKNIRFRVTNNTTNNDWRVDTGGGYFGWNYAISDELTPTQKEKLLGDGIEFKLVLEGTKIKVYLDGVDMFPNTDFNISGITGDAKGKAGFKLFGNIGYETEIPFSVSKKATITIVDDIANGNITTDKEKYVTGDKVTLTVAGEDGYYYSSLKVDGEEVVADANGEYTFTASKENHTVEATFAPAIFETNADFNVLSQNKGVLRVPASEKEQTSWIVTKDSSYNEVTATVKVLGDQTKIFAFYEELVIGNKNIRFRVTNNTKNGDWRVDTGGGVFGWGTESDELTPAQKEKLFGDGIEFKLVLEGTKVKVYLDGVNMFPNKELNISGITEGAKGKAGFKLYGNTGYETEIKFQLGL